MGSSLNDMASEYKSFVLCHLEVLPLESLHWDTLGPLVPHQLCLAWFLTAWGDSGGREGHLG